MVTYEIPLSPNAQSFSIALAGVTYVLTLTWNSQSAVWNLNIADKRNINILTGIPLVANVDLLAPYGYLNFGGKLIAFTDHSPDDPPTYGNIGSSGHLLFVVM